MILYVCAAVFFAGMFYLGCGMGGDQNRGGERNEGGAVAFQIGNTPVLYEDFNNELSQQLEQQMGQGGTPESVSPLMDAEMEAQLIQQDVQKYGTLELARRAGVKFTDDQIRKQMELEVESQISSQRMQMIQQKKLNANATPKEFDEALKKNNMPTVAEIQKRFADQINTLLKDPSIRPKVEQQVAPMLVMAALQASVHPSLAEIKATYDSYQFKQILFVAHPGSTVDSQIAKVQADLKAGSSFEQEVNRYSSTPPVKGKKLSENVITIMGTQFAMIPYYAPLKNLKPGQVSDPIDTPQGKSIYKLVNVKNAAPPDLEKNQAKYEKDFAMQQAQTQMEEQLKSLSQSVQWKIPGLKALYDWSQARFNGSPAQMTQAMQAVISESKQAAHTSAFARPAMLAWYAAFDSIWNAQGADKTKLLPDRIEVLKALSSVVPNFDLEMELVDLLVQTKEPGEAVDALKQAASSNIYYDATGERDFHQVGSEILKLKAAGVLKPADETALDKIQQDWAQADQESQKEKAEMKAEQLKAQQEAAANEAQQKAAVAKEKAEAAKAGKANAPAGNQAAPPKGSPPPANPPAGAPPKPGGSTPKR